MKIAVTSPSFSKHPKLIETMESSFDDFKLNTDGIRFNEDELITYLKGYDGAIVGLDTINERVLSSLPNMQIISKYGVGLNNIDKEACKNHNVKIGWTGGVNKLSVAELALGNILSLSRNIYQSSSLLSKGEWKKDGGFQLTGKTVGIIGVGHIGKELIRLLAPFSCTILVNDIIDQTDYYKNNNLIEASKEEIYKKCEVISIHTPFDSNTKNMINTTTLDLMKKGVVLINSARGGIVNEQDLKEKLKKHEVAAALDVFETEPPTDLELLSLPNLICTPHIGGNAREAVESMGLSAINHIKEFYNLK